MRFSRKVFVKNFREKLTKFRENCDSFRKSFRFRERSKKCFRPNPTPETFRLRNYRYQSDSSAKKWTREGNLSIS
jgi:hypothetical protein